MKPVRLLIIVALVTFASQDSAKAQLLPTSLKITVLDELGNPVQDAEVNIYDSKDNYLNSKQAIATMQTNEKGMVKFKKLEAQVYFIEATKDAKKNDGLGSETSPLIKGRTNKVNVVIQ
jgi:uncharacterized GH25 family protein